VEVTGGRLRFAQAVKSKKRADPPLYFISADIEGPVPVELEGSDDIATWAGTLRTRGFLLYFSINDRASNRRPPANGALRGRFAR
jgi:hypothetical protein